MALVKQAFLVLALGGVLAMFMPWWSVAVAGGLVGIIFAEHRGRSFLAGFLGIWLLWMGMASWLMISTGSDLGHRFAILANMGNGWVLALVSALIGGIVAGTAGFTGSSLRKLF